MTVMVPTPAAVTDAFAILKVLADPAAARELLHDIQSAADTHAVSLAQVMERLKEVEARERAVAGLEEQAKEKASWLGGASAALERREAEHASAVAAHATAVADLNKQTSAHAAAVEGFQGLVSAQQAEYAAKMATVEQRDRQYASEHTAATAALDARAADLEARETVLTSAQADLADRKQQLKALVG